MRLKHNFNLKSRQFREYAKRLGSTDRAVLLQAVRRALDEVGFIATQDYMELDSPEVGPAGPLLSRRSGRLSRSLLGAATIGGAGGGSVKESIREAKYSGGILTGIIGTTVPYAEIHEYGGVIPITSKARGFFWYQFMQTGDTKWKAMALSKKSSFTMPKRAFLRPAAKDAMPEIHEIFHDFIEDSFKRAHI